MFKTDVNVSFRKFFLYVCTSRLCPSIGTLLYNWTEGPFVKVE